jgi:hypothetical protein
MLFSTAPTSSGSTLKLQDTEIIFISSFLLSRLVLPNMTYKTLVGYMPSNITVASPQVQAC